MTAQVQTGFGGLPRTAPLEMVIDFINRLLIGRLNISVVLTLRASQTTTTLTDSRIGANSVIIATPLTADAATALPSLWYSNFAKGSCTVNHASSANVDQTFRFGVVG